MKSTYQFCFGAILLSMSQAVKFQGESLISPSASHPTCEAAGQRVTDMAKTHCDYFRAVDAAGRDICKEDCKTGDPEGYGSCESRCDARFELLEDDTDKIEQCFGFAE